MKDSEADIAIGVLNKLIDQELEAVRAATRDGNTPFVGYAQTRHNAFLYARDEIRKALAAAVDERVRGIRSCRSVTSWSRRICTPAICAAGGVQVPSIP